MKKKNDTKGKMKYLLGNQKIWKFESNKLGLNFSQLDSISRKNKIKKSFEYSVLVQHPQSKEQLCP
jgi:hypothetical protein